MIGLFIGNSAFSTEQYSGKDEANGIHYSTYKDFPKKWQLVTIRFRKDTGEIRITYANELAMKTLASGAISYPDGAAFAKTNVLTSLDEQYPNSIAPREISRYQFMVRDGKKYAETNGWGYAIFTANGKTYPEEPHKTAMACYSCHLAAENRGDVFSRPFSFLEKAQMPMYEKAPVEFFSYVWDQTSNLSANVKELVSKKYKKVRVLNNKKLMDNVFQGTLDELKPLLMSESKKSKAPALFMASDKLRFVLVQPTSSEKCADLTAYQVISTDLNFKNVEELSCANEHL